MVSKFTWETASDWDNAASDDGVVHESVANTDHDDETQVKQGFSIASPVKSFTTGRTAVFYPLQEDSGTTVYDFSGNSNDGDIKSLTKINDTGLAGTSSYYFDAANNDHCAIQPRLRDPYDAMTVLAWVKTTSTGQSMFAHDRSEYYRLSNGNMSGVASGNLGVHLTDNGGSTLDLDSGVAIDDGNWHHVGFVYDAGDITVYVDGSSVKTATQGSQIGTSTQRFGYLGTGSEALDYDDGNTGGNYYTGNIADVRIDIKAYTSSEISTLYDSVATSGSLITTEKVS